MARVGRHLVKLLKRPHLWALLVILGLCTLPQYGEHWGIPGSLSFLTFLGLKRYTIERILYLLPIIYASLAFGPVVGIITSLVSLLLMMPRALFFSPAPVDAVIETMLVTLFGVLSSLYLRAERGWREEKEKDTMKLQWARG